MADKTDHDEHAHGGMGHVLPASYLIGVWIALMIFTVATVEIARMGLGSQTSFTVAMIIATVKAGLVMAIFMHLWWDKRLNLLSFLGAFLFVLLFIGMLLTDKSEYAPDIAKRLEAEAQQAAP
jgi:cytochrome c oxidase subunit 4